MSRQSTADERPAEGVRERKKRLLRQHLSDTATRMFLDRGFDAVRVAEVAAACGVTEKTVFNYFPSKEALLLDRLEPAVEAVRTGLADPAVAPVTAMLRILNHEIEAITATLATGDAEAAARTLRFGELLRTNPSLRAYRHDLIDRCAAAISEVLARRAGLRPEDPEPRITARALLGLWQVQADSLHLHLGAGHPPDRIRAAVDADLRRAARLLEHGLGQWN